jgi:hypothetical protein
MSTIVNTNTPCLISDSASAIAVEVHEWLVTVLMIYFKYHEPSPLVFALQMHVLQFADANINCILFFKTEIFFLYVIGYSPLPHLKSSEDINFNSYIHVVKNTFTVIISL